MKKDLRDMAIELLFSALENGKSVIVSGDIHHQEYTPTKYYLVDGAVWVSNYEIGTFAHPHITTAIQAAIFIEKLSANDCSFCIR